MWPELPNGAVPRSRTAAQTERGDRMLTLMATRHARHALHALDLGALDLVERAS
jgi:hypothetical protein